MDDVSTVADEEEVIEISDDNDDDDDDVGGSPPAKKRDDKATNPPFPACLPTADQHGIEWQKVRIQNAKRAGEKVWLATFLPCPDYKFGEKHPDPRPVT